MVQCVMLRVLHVPLVAAVRRAVGHQAFRRVHWIAAVVPAVVLNGPGRTEQPHA